MQKKLIALAVAGLSTAAFAQSSTNVTIYGVADVSGQGFSVQKGNGLAKGSGGAQGNVFALSNNSSLLGFRGTEDLGGGLKAIFQAESYLNITGQGQSGISTSNTAVATSAAASTNSTAFGQLRDSYVGLQGKWGTVLGGYNSTPFRNSLVSFDVMPGATGSSQIDKIMGTLRVTPSIGGSQNTTASTQFASSIRATSVAYALPTLYGFDASIAYTGSNNDGQNNNGSTVCVGTSCIGTPSGLKSAFGANLGWTGYGVNVQGAYQNESINSGVTAATGGFGNYTSYLLGVSYTGVPGLKVAGVYVRNQVAGVGTQDGTKLKNNQFWLGASYRINNWEPRVSAVWSGNVNGSGNLEAAGTTGGNQLGARQWTANLGYYLSKRTQVYGLISQLHNSANQNYVFGQSQSNLVPTAGGSAVTYGMGVRHTF